MNNFYSLFLKNGLNAIELYAKNGLTGNYSLAFPTTAPSNNSTLVWDTAASAFKWVDSSTFGIGTVTSVGLNAPNDFTVSGSPITGSGTLALAWASKASNLVLASPLSGAGVPSFRALGDADLPSVISASRISGQLAKSNVPGGTTATTFQLNNNSGVIFADDSAGTALKLFDNTGAAYADLYVKNLYISGRVDELNTTTVNLGDSVLRLNSAFTTGTPSQNAGLAVARGSQNDAQFIWTESAGNWQAGLSSNMLPITRRVEKSIVNADLTAGVYVFTHNIGALPIIQVVSDLNEVIGVKVTHTNVNTCSLDFTRVGTLTSTWKIIAIG